MGGDQIDSGGNLCEEGKYEMEIIEQRGKDEDGGRCTSREKGKTEEGSNNPTVRG